MTRLWRRGVTADVRQSSCCEGETQLVLSACRDPSGALCIERRRRARDGRVANERAPRAFVTRGASPKTFSRGAIAKGGRARRPRAIDRPKPPRRANSSSPRCLLCDSHAVRSRRLTGSASFPNSAVTPRPREQQVAKKKRDRRRRRAPPTPPPSRHARASRSRCARFPHRVARRLRMFRAEPAPRCTSDPDFRSGSLPPWPAFRESVSS